MQHETRDLDVGSGNESSTRQNKHTTSENRDDDAASSLSSLSSKRAALTITPRIENNKKKSAIVTTSQPRGGGGGGGGTIAPPRDDHRYGTSLAWNGPNDANDDDEVNANDDECIPTINRIVGMTKTTNNDDPTAPSTTTPTITERISKKALSTLKTYPLRVIEQLRLCERIIKTNHHKQGCSNSSIVTATHPDGKVVIGFECIHCVNCSTSTKDCFRKFPKSPNEVGNELVKFHDHLTKECQGIPADLRDYISWIKKRGWYKTSYELCNIGGVVMSSIYPKWEQHYKQQQTEVITSCHTMRTNATTTTTTTTGSKRMKTTTMDERKKKAHAPIAKRRRLHHHSILEDLA